MDDVYDLYNELNKINPARSPMLTYIETVVAALRLPAGVTARTIPPGGGWGGTYDHRDRTITVADDPEFPAAWLEHIATHEAGHAWDWELDSDLSWVAERDRAIYEIHRMARAAGVRLDYYGQPRELVAEGYAAAALTGTAAAYADHLGWPAEIQHAMVELGRRLLARVTRHG